MKSETIAKALGGAVLLAAAAQATRSVAVKRPAAPARRPETSPEARGLHAAAALLAASVLADSGLEHYRGSFENPAMYAPLVSAALALGFGAEGASLMSAGARAARRNAYGLAAGTGAAGLGFHLFNLLKRPGGASWLNLFYGAPLGAPAALAVSGLIGLAATRLEGPRAFPLGLSAGRTLCGLLAVALAGTVTEAALFHFRGAFQNPVMWAPVSLPPVAAALLAAAALERPIKRDHPLTRAWLWMTTALGAIGMGFHAYGVSRAMGGWRNWSQNLVDGPPLPAPPSFSALALAGLSALSLLEKESAR